MLAFLLIRGLKLTYFTNPLRRQSCLDALGLGRIFCAHRLLLLVLVISPSRIQYDTLVATTRQ